MGCRLSELGFMVDSYLLRSTKRNQKDLITLGDLREEALGSNEGFDSPQQVCLKPGYTRLAQLFHKGTIQSLFLF